MDTKKQIFHGFKKGMHAFGKRMSTLVNSFLLLIVYFIGVGFVFVIAKFSKKNLLEKKLHDESYWSELNIKKRPLSEHYRQF